ncbi:unnamed protein product [Paramecium pentaurelia]|uniref:Uncharacterized protein n=1 Tax=Paramecium pentaurelia TaxID=43138 RepID=A0A8S1WL61_9CILI|nr:unnamed protein product [Paramecium pentaurelia]
MRKNKYCIDCVILQFKMLKISSIFIDQNQYTKFYFQIEISQEYYCNQDLIDQKFLSKVLYSFEITQKQRLFEQFPTFFCFEKSKSHVVVIKSIKKLQYF